MVIYCYCSQEISKEIQALKADYQKKKKINQRIEAESSSKEVNNETKEENEIVKEFKQNLEKYKDLKSSIPKKGSSRESMTMELLAGFKKKLQEVKDKLEEQEVEYVGGEVNEDNELW